MPLATNLKTLREKKGLSQEKFGQKFGLSRNQVNSYERESARPSIEIVVKICEYYKITVKDLIK